MVTRSAAPILLCLLAGCAADRGPYPSLAPRAGEKLGFDEPVVTRPPAVADPALDDEIVDWAKRLDSLAAGFDGAAATARKRATARLTVGSDAWLDAQAAAATLDDWRTRTTALTAEIDAAGSARAAKLLPPYPTLEALRERAAAETDREAGVTAGIQAAIPAA